MKYLFLALTLFSLKTYGAAAGLSVSGYPNTNRLADTNRFLIADVENRTNYNISYLQLNNQLKTNILASSDATNLITAIANFINANKLDTTNGVAQVSLTVRGQLISTNFLFNSTNLQTTLSNLQTQIAAIGLSSKVDMTNGYATNLTLSIPIIGDYTLAQHGHTNAMSGGQLDASAIVTGTIDPARLGGRTIIANVPLFVVNGNGISGNPTLFIPKATANNDGYISSNDWNGFALKQNAFVTGLGITNNVNVLSNNIVAGTSITIVKGPYGQLTINSLPTGSGAPVGTVINTASTISGQIAIFNDNQKTNLAPITIGIGLTNNGSVLSNNIVAGVNMSITADSNGQLTLTPTQPTYADQTLVGNISGSPSIPSGLTVTQIQTLLGLGYGTNYLPITNGFGYGLSTTNFTNNGVNLQTALDSKALQSNLTVVSNQVLTKIDSTNGLGTNLFVDGFRVAQDTNFVTVHQSGNDIYFSTPWTNNNRLEWKMGWTNTQNFTTIFGLNSINIVSNTTPTNHTVVSSVSTSTDDLAPILTDFAGYIDGDHGWLLPKVTLTAHGYSVGDKIYDAGTTYNYTIVKIEDANNFWIVGNNPQTPNHTLTGLSTNLTRSSSMAGYSNAGVLFFPSVLTNLQTILVDGNAFASNSFAYGHTIDFITTHTIWDVRQAYSLCVSNSGFNLNTVPPIFQRTIDLKFKPQGQMSAYDTLYGIASTNWTLLNQGGMQVVPNSLSQTYLVIPNAATQLGVNPSIPFAISSAASGVLITNRSDNMINFGLGINSSFLIQSNAGWGQAMVYDPLIGNSAWNRSSTTLWWLNPASGKVYPYSGVGDIINSNTTETVVAHRKVYPYTGQNEIPLMRDDNILPSFSSKVGLNLPAYSIPSYVLTNGQTGTIGFNTSNPQTFWNFAGDATNAVFLISATNVDFNADSPEFKMYGYVNTNIVAEPFVGGFSWKKISTGLGNGEGRWAVFQHVTGNYTNKTEVFSLMPNGTLNLLSLRVTNSVTGSNFIGDSGQLTGNAANIHGIGYLNTPVIATSSGGLSLKLGTLNSGFTNSTDAHIGTIISGFPVGGSGSIGYQSRGTALGFGHYFITGTNGGLVRLYISDFKSDFFTNEVDVGTLVSAGVVSSGGTGFSGPGVNITTFDVSHLTTGTIPVSRMPALNTLGFQGTTSQVLQGNGSGTLNWGSANAAITTGIGVTNNGSVLSNNITAGTGISLTGGANGQISIAATGGSGTVTSVGATVPSIFSISGSPVTTSGTLAMTYSGTALPVANGGTGFTDRTLKDSAGTPKTSIDWDNRIMYDNVAGNSIDYGRRLTTDTNGISSMNWSTRKLFNNSGQTVLDWSGNLTGLGLTNNGATLSNNIVAGTGVTITAGASGQLTIASGNAYSVITTLTNYTITTYHTFLIASAASLTITLPTAVGHAGEDIIIKDNSTPTITINSSGGSIDGVGTYPFPNPYSSRQFISDGANWWVANEP